MHQSESSGAKPDRIDARPAALAVVVGLANGFTIVKTKGRHFPAMWAIPLAYLLVGLLASGIWLLIEFSPVGLVVLKQSWCFAW